MPLSRRAALVAAFLLAASPAAAMPPGLAAYIASRRRSPAYVRRDRYRHPGAVLSFFGLKRNMSVLEIEPGGGYWTEILAPYLKRYGRYTVALRGNTPEQQAAQVRFLKKLGADPRDFALVSTVAMTPGKPLGAAGSYDLILSFRNLHDWMAEGTASEILAAIFVAMKPGGIFGIVDHSASNDAPQDPKARSGYVRQDYATALIERAGFKLVASSEINANPRDTKAYADGVWDLPPELRQGEVDRSKYLAIGESDRWTLKFTKA